MVSRMVTYIGLADVAVIASCTVVAILLVIQLLTEIYLILLL